MSGSPPSKRAKVEHDADDAPQRDPTEWTLQEHQQCGKDIHTWYKLIEFYIDEMHQKKMHRKTAHGRYHSNDEEIERTYSMCLFYKRKQRSSFDDFPSAFKSELEDCMYRDYDGKDGCTTQVYYNQSGKGLTPSDGPDPTPLDSKPYLTDEDHAKLRSLNLKYVAFMDKCIAHAKRHAKRRRNHSEFNKMKRFRERVFQHGLNESVA
jgi:hypothetical protein